MKQIIFIVLLGLAITSCQKSSETASTGEDTTKSSSAEFEMARESFFNHLMDPADAAAQIQFSAAEFNAALMNDPKLHTQYTGNEVKAAANLGIYLADLNYSVAYQKPAKEYFAAAQELSKTIGGEKGTLEFLAKRYDDNLAQNDSVKKVVTDLLAKSTAKLKGTEKEKLAGIAMAAYQIENLHLALGLLESYPKDILPSDARQAILVPLFRLVLNQKANVEVIYSFLKSVTSVKNPDQNPNYPYYAQAFEELIAVYHKLNIEEKIANNQGTELLSDAVVKELSEKVNAIRNKIVSIE